MVFFFWGWVGWLVGWFWWAALALRGCWSCGLLLLLFLPIGLFIAHFFIKKNTTGEEGAWRAGGVKICSPETLLYAGAGTDGWLKWN